jgi:cytochrome c oxidase subunit 2
MDLGALDPAGREAEQIAELFWWMTGGAAVIWVAVVGLSIYAAYLNPRPVSSTYARRLIILGGAVVPTVVLSALLVYGLALLPPLLEPAPPGSLRIHVTAEQWWWRIRYLAPGEEPVELANELRLPVGKPVELELESRDVIHSFWIPALAGKMDMIPGRRTRLKLQPVRTGAFRGVCAEYCGASHAFMLFPVHVVDPAEFDRWLARQRRPAGPPPDPLAERGGRAFLAAGCGSCHSVRGTAASGRIAPDLTHVGSRDTLAAGRLANDPAEFHRWIANPGELKPGARMPAFGMLPDEELRALAAFLEGLQ